RKATALVVVLLFVATAVGLVLYNSPTETPLQVNPPRWKDESATHFTFAAAGDFGGPESVDSIALMQRARTAGMSFVLALGALGYTMDEARSITTTARTRPTPSGSKGRSRTRGSTVFPG